MNTERNVNRKVTAVITSVLYFGHPKNGRPGFFAVVENFSVAFTPQQHNGCLVVRLAKDEEDIDEDGDISKMNQRRERKN